jgi:non-ribosomal peptide synthetase component E (peptide arylation enzyme)
MITVSQEKITEYTEKGYWGEKTLLDLLNEHAAAHPEADALVDPDNREALVGGAPKRFTYARMMEAVDGIAAGFQSLGIGRDDIILVQLPNVVEIVLTYLAAARVGAISSPLSMMARSHELSGAVRVTGARAIVTVAEFNGFDHDRMIREVQREFPVLEHRILAGEHTRPEAMSMEAWILAAGNAAGPGAPVAGPNDVFTICWTSGTEADPKGVPHTHNEWIAISRVVVEGCQMTPGFNIHGSFPVINMAGFGGTLVPWAITGGKFVLHHPFDQDVFFAQLAREQLDYTLMPPALLNALAKSPAVESLASLSVKVIGSGSVPLSPWMVRFYQDRFNIGIVNFFASNEGVAFFSAPRFFPEPEDRASYFPRFGRPEVTWKVPEQVVGGMRSRLVKPGTSDEILQVGDVGELCFAGPTVFTGYWNRPDLTEATIDEDGYYHTGDLFSIEGEQRDKYLFRGRFKDLIIRGGQNISPEEVETLIIGHPKVQEVAAVGCPDERLCERTCAVVVPVSGETITLAEIVAFMESKGVAKYKLPERLEIMEALPKNAVQKVLRRKIRDWLWKKVAAEKGEGAEPVCE